MGDSMADWLASGLEDAFADRPEFGIVRKHRTVSGLVRYDPRRDVEWAQVAREIIAADKPKFIVMMIGYHDRQPIRERTPTPAGRPAAPQHPDDAELQDTDSPEGRAKASAAQQNEEMRKPRGKDRGAAESQRGAAESQIRGAAEGGADRADGIPQRRLAGRLHQAHRRHHCRAPQRQCAGVLGRPAAAAQSARRARTRSISTSCSAAAPSAPASSYVDIWDGFVDEAGRYVLQGPDVDGQIRRLRSGDTVYFTKAGARKLAHYVEREIQRAMVNRALTVALPAPEPAVQTRPGAARPVAGPVIPLTAAIGGGNELLGGGTTRAAAGRSGREQGAGARRADRGAGRPRRQFRLAAQQWRGKRRAGNAEGRGGCDGACGRARGQRRRAAPVAARGCAAEAGAGAAARAKNDGQPASRSSRRSSAAPPTQQQIPMRRGRRCRSRRRRRRRSRSRAGSGDSSSVCRHRRYQYLRPRPLRERAAPARQRVRIG